MGAIRSGQTVEEACMMQAASGTFFQGSRNDHLAESAWPNPHGRIKVNPNWDAGIILSFIKYPSRDKWLFLALSGIGIRWH